MEQLAAVLKPHDGAMHDRLAALTGPNVNSAVKIVPVCRVDVYAGTAEFKMEALPQSNAPSDASSGLGRRVSAPTPSERAYPLARASSVLQRPSDESIPADAAPSVP